jgi:Kef-type K+ transport system membrane component KefB
MDFFKKFEELPMWAKIILIIAVPLIPAAFRIFRYFETKNNSTLVVGILCVVPSVGMVFQIIDVVNEITDNRIKFCMD